VRVVPVKLSGRIAVSEQFDDKLEIFGPIQNGFSHRILSRPSQSDLLTDGNPALVEKLGNLQRSQIAQEALYAKFLHLQKLALRLSLRPAWQFIGPVRS
jgi:hypothetical protein